MQEEHKAAKKYNKKKEKKSKERQKLYKYTIKKRIYKQWERLLNVISQTENQPNKLLTKEARS